MTNSIKNSIPPNLKIKGGNLKEPKLLVKKKEDLLFLEKVGIHSYISCDLSNRILRTVVGWCMGHSNTPNCTLYPCDNEGKDVPFGKQTAYKIVVCVYKINGGEELTIDYNKHNWIFGGELYPPKLKFKQQAIPDNLYRQPVECYNDLDCPPGYICVNGRLVPYDPTI